MIKGKPTDLTKVETMETLEKNKFTLQKMHEKHKQKIK